MSSTQMNDIETKKPEVPTKDIKTVENIGPNIEPNP